MKIIHVFITLLLVLKSTAVFAKRPPTPVFVSIVKKQQIVNNIQALGTLKACESVTLTSTVTERVIKVNFTDGQRVTKGDVLIEMDITEETALIAEEKFRLKEIEKRIHRLKPLIKRGAMSQSTMDTAMMELETSQARISALKTHIKHRRITAPFDGVLGMKNISPGALLQPGTVITTLDNDNIMKLDFRIAEHFLSSLIINSDLESTTSPYPDKLFKGKISSIGSRIDPDTRSVVVRGIIPNLHHNLKPGLLMHVKIKNKKDNILTVPEESLIVRGNKKFVFVIEDNNGISIARLVEIKTGIRYKGGIEVLDGVGVGDKVVTHGILRIRNGSTVVVKAVDTGKNSLQDMLKQHSAPKRKGS